MPHDTQLNIRVPAVLKRLIDDEAQKRQMSTSRFIRDAVRTSILSTRTTEALIDRDALDAAATEAVKASIAKHLDDMFGVD
jgi:hypothetical protein